MHADLIDVLDSSWHAVAQETAEATAFRVPEGWQNAAVLRCPDCHQIMEKYGYMGLAAIQINRCDPCAEIWLDTDELQNMVLALAKSNYRSEADWERSQREKIVLPGVAAPGTVKDQSLRNVAWLFGEERFGSPIVPALSLLAMLLP